MSSPFESTRLRVETALNDLSGQEIYLPSAVDVHFFFSSHGSAEDIGNPDSLRNLIRHSDIVALECAQFDEEFIRGYNKLSNGDFKEYEYQRNHFKAKGDTYQLELSRALYNTKKVVTAIDIAEDEPLSAQVHHLLTARRTLARYDNPTGDLDGSIQTILDVEDDWATAQAYRERRMLLGFGPRLDGVIANHKRLSRQETVKVLVIMGSLHTSLFHQLREVAGTEAVTRSFGNDLPVFPGAEIVQRAKLLGVELTDTARRNAVLYGFVGNMVRQLCEGLSLGKNLTRYGNYRIEARISRSFSPEEIEQYYRSERNSVDESEEEFREKVSQAVLSAYESS